MARILRGIGQHILCILTGTSGFGQRTYMTSGGGDLLMAAKRILIVDDEPTIVKFLTGFLSRDKFIQ